MRNIRHAHLGRLWSIALLPLVLLAGCGDMPRDPDGTLERVRASRIIRVGAVAGAEQADLVVASHILRRISAQTSAAPDIVGGTLEPLLLRLEAGQLDLVVGGRFDKNSPWSTRVAFGPSFRRHAEGENVTASHVVARNGENAWITLVERETRAGAPRQ